MVDVNGKTIVADAGSRRPAVNPTSADSAQLLHVITALNLIRMNLEMYPPGHGRIAESVERAFDTIQKILREKGELRVGFAGDTVMFGETAPEREKANAAFRDYSRSLNNLRIVDFTLNRGLKKDDLREFNRILSVKPADIWALGRVESVISRAGITGVTVKVIDADRVRLEKKKEVIQPRVDRKEKNERFWEEFFARLKAEAAKKGESDGLPADREKIDPVEVIRFLNREREQWPSAVFSYEKMVVDYFAEPPRGRQISAEKQETLTGVNSLVGSLHPELKRQLIDVVERQMILHADAALVPENLQCFPSEIFREIIRQTNEKGAQISPTLVNLLKKMAAARDAPDGAGQAEEQDLSSKDMETLLKREAYEKYVPEAYDRLLKKASESSSGDGGGEESRFPLQECLKTLAPSHVDFQICRLIHSLMDGEIGETEYLACAGKIGHALPDLLTEGRFAFLITVRDTLRRHSQEKPVDGVKQRALALLRTLSDTKTIAKYVTPLIRKGLEEPAPLTAFLVAGGEQNLTWLFDLYLDPKTPLSATAAEVIKGFGQSATDEAVRRLHDKESLTLVRLLTLIREIADRSVAPSLRNLFHHGEWAVRREVIRTLVRFDDPAVTELLRTSLKAVNHDEVYEAVGLSCRYRVHDLLDDLTAMLKTVVVREEGAMLNEWIVGELAKTGDPSVISHLERIAATWFTLTPQALSRTKVALYRNLGHFPEDSIRKLLRRGRRSRNREVRAIAAHMLKGRE